MRWERISTKKICDNFLANLGIGIRADLLANHSFAMNANYEQ